MTSYIQENIDHVVVLMLENRSFDDLVGWLYTDDAAPNHFLPTNSPPLYNGLHGADYWNPTELSGTPNKIYTSQGVDNYFIPTPDPNEHFNNMNRQLFGLNIDISTTGWLPPEGAVPGMQGFLYDYSTAKKSSPEIANQIMQTYDSGELTAMSSVAKEYAISDNYHASSPTQTWPNRAFMHAGTSMGNVNNFPYLPYDTTTIFNLLEDSNVSWKVYKSSHIIPSLTRLQMVKLWDPLLFDHFKHIEDFIADCQTGNLPAYSFLEPTFVVEDGVKATSEHPPADVCAGDHFLQTICNAVINSPAFSRTLFIINFDEHGACPDHVPPNWTATPPDKQSSPGKQGFYFNRYGVRVPAIFVSPYISAGTVFRANSDPWSTNTVPYDHTSILAMILDWKNIDRKKLPSARIGAQPKNPFDDLLASPLRTDKPDITATCTPADSSTTDSELTSLQKSILVADLHYRTAQASGFKKGVFADQEAIDELLSAVKTCADMVTHFKGLHAS